MQIFISQENFHFFRSLFSARVLKLPFYICLILLIHSNTLFAAPFSLSYTTSDYNGYQISCFGLSDGSIDLTITGGIAPFTYNWNTGDTIEDLNGLIAGTYNVLVTDSAGDTSSVSVVLTQPALLSLTFTIADDTCSKSVGTILSNVIGGVGTNYLYNWSNGSSASSINSLLAGMYTVTVTDSNACALVRDTTLSEISGPSLSGISTDVSCNGGMDGGIALTVTGGSSPFTYLWSDGSSNQNLSLAAAGIYTVTVTDSNNCTATFQDTIVQPSLLSLNMSSVNSTCALANGSASVLVSGGTSSYMYSWNDGNTNSTNTNISSGTYTVTVTDANNCTASNSVLVNNTAGPVISIGSFNDVSCSGGNNGSITISISNGTAPFSFLWSDGSTTQNRTSLIAGNYTVTVSDANSCTSSVSQVISQPSPISITLTPVNATCGSMNGSISSAVGGGVSPYSYVWSTGSTNSSISSLAAGNYTVTVTDVNTCTQTMSASITSLGSPTVTLNSVTNITCNAGSNGSININVSNGTGPYSFLWSNGLTTQNISGLIAGTYTVTVTDANSCTATLSQTLTQASALSISLSGTNTTCGLNNGSVSNSVSGGTPAYNYLWSTGSTNQNISSLASGTYTVTVSDANTCTKTSSQTIGSVIAPSISVSTFGNVACNGGNNGFINIAVSNGTAPFSFLWSNGSTNQNINSLAAATYTVTVTDANLCTATQSRIISQPSALTLNMSSGNSTCGSANGNASVVVGGGTPSFSYVWNNGGTNSTISSLIAGSYTVTVTDGNNCTSSASVVVANTNGPTLSVFSSSNVSCNGGSNGSVTINVSAGTSPYSFAWSNGATTQNLINLTAGTYTVTVSDNNACTSTVSATITQPSVLTVGFTSSNPTCGNSNGSITAIPNGGTSPYTYVWSTGSTLSTISLLNAATYTVTISDINGCTISGNRTLTNQTGPIVGVNNIQNVSCFGLNNGGIQINVSGGTAPFTFSWSNGSTNQNLSNVVAATYTVTVSDANACSATVSASITQPALLTAGITKTNATCALNNGMATVVPLGGTSPYSFLWNIGSTTNSISALSPGIYTVTVTDFNGCTRSSNTNILAITPPSLLLDSALDVSCFSGNDGAIYVSVVNGTAPYSYVWSNATTIQDISNISAGTYTVTVTDANSCTSTLSTVISEPTQIVINTNTIPATCGASNGSASALASGGTSPYTYLWSTGSTNTSITSLSAGVYTVTITDANACTRSRSVNLVNVGGPQINITSISNVTCNGGNNGSINISISGGTSPYSFLWSNGLTTQNISSLLAGSYTVTVTDQNTCQASADTVVSEPLPISITLNKINATCGSNNGVITANVSGGTNPYNYLWSNGSTFSSISGLSSGNYTVTVSDGNACTKTASSNIINTGNPSIFISSLNNVTCNGGSNGSINITVLGGTSPYSFLWSNGATTQNVSGLSAGNYTITVTDFNSCVSTSTYSISEPNAIVVSITKVNEKCNQANGSATALPSGGAGTYSYAWSNGSTNQMTTNLAAAVYTVTVSDLNSCTGTASTNILNISGPSIALNLLGNESCFNSANGFIDISISNGQSPFSYSWSNGATTQDVSNLSAATYTVTVTDINSCSSTASFTISSPTVLLLSTSSTGTNCGVSNGTASALASGGTTPYSFVWNTGSTNSNITSLSAGVYTVTVSDANACTTTASVTVPVLGGPQITVDSIIQVSCFNGSDGNIYLSVSGGVSPYSYDWSNGSSVQDLINVAAGIYTITVSDLFGCTVTQSFNINQPNALSISSSVINPSCALSNGSISIIASGGSSPYNYLWNTGQTTASVSSLNSGTYTVTITDSQSCTKDTVITLTNSGVPSVALDSTINVTCNGLSNGAIYISVSNGLPTYSYIWSNGSSSQDITSIANGVYTVTVTDQTGCTTTSSYTITQPTALSLSTSSTPADCNISNGSASVLPSGGTSPYTYLWNTGSTLSSITSLTPSTYTVTVTDNNSCSATSTIQVNNPGGPNVTLLNKTNVSCFGGNNGSISVNISGGSSPYLFLWNTGSTNQNISGLTSAIYTVTVTDGANCTATLSANITQPTALNLSTSQSASTCGLNNGSASASISGGTPSYSFIWNTGQTTASINNIAGGIYTVTVSDANLCTQSASITVGSLNAANITLNTIQNVNCNGQTNGSININVSGNGPFSYIWSNGATTQDINNIGAGNYTVTLTDNNGCTSVFDTLIIQPQAISLSLNITQPTCGQSNGTISANSSGGVTPHSYIWNTGSTQSSITGVPQGVYTLTITDQNACVLDTVFNLIGAGSPTSQLDSIVDNVCFGGNSGAIYIQINGGANPYSYIWSNGSTTQDIISLAAGTYTVTITDQAACTITASYVVGQSSAIQIGSNITPASCNVANGAVCALPSGGTAPYAFSWSTGSTNNCLSSIIAANYTVTITDAKGCTNLLLTTVNNLAAPIISVIDSGLISCFGFSNGYINTQISSGSPPFTFSWSNGASTQNISNLSAGLYSLTVSDSVGCIVNKNILITQPDSISTSATIPLLNGTYEITCNGDNDGSINLTVTGGTPSFSFAWSDGSSLQNRTNLSAGIYSVIISDSNGCVKQNQYLLEEPPMVTAEAGFDQVICGEDSIFISALAPTYGVGTWSIISGNAAIANAASNNTYLVNADTGTIQLLWTVTDGICTDTALLNVTVLDQIVAKGGPNQITCEDSVTMAAIQNPTYYGFWMTYDTLLVIADSLNAFSVISNLQVGINELYWIVQNGSCIDSARVQIIKNTPGSCETGIIAANTFTPNGDGFNDTFVIQGIEDFLDNELKVFNRWGNIVFESSPYNNKWKGLSESGNVLPEGTYFYILTIPSKDILLKGFIELRR